MLEGVQLTLQAGPGLAFPVSGNVISALRSAKVTTAAGQDSGFELVFSMGDNSPVMSLFLLNGMTLPPVIRVILSVMVNGVSDVLIDGVVTEQKMSPGDGVNATLTVRGTDLTAVMGWDVISTEGVPFPAMPPEARVVLLLAKYAVLGVVPLVIPSVLIDTPIPTHHVPRQQGNDLEYIRSLAEEVGYVFYLDAGPSPGQSVGYWGPEIKVGAAQPALNLNLGVERNVESLEFSLEGDNKRLPILWLVNEETHAPIPIPIPDITPLNPPLGKVPAIPKGINWLVGTAKLSPIRAAMIGLAVAAKESEVVFATGSLDVARYGRVLKARQLVGVRGAGSAFDGLYYVASVTHSLERGRYRQDFKLARNGLYSTLSTVPA